MAQYTSQARIPSEVTALAPDPIQHESGNGAQMAGDMLLELSANLQAAKEASQEANGIAENNALWDEYSLSIEGTDPREEGVDWLKGSQAVRQKQLKILESKSPRVRASLKNRFAVENQKRQAMLAMGSIKKTKQLTLSELPDVRQMYAARGERDAFEGHLEKIRGMLTDVEYENELFLYGQQEQKLLRQAEYDNAIGEIKADPVEGLKNARANPYLTNGQKNALDNIYINQKKINENIVEFEKELKLQQYAEIISKTTDSEIPAMSNPEEAQATITAMLENKDKDIRRQGERAQKILNASLKPPSETAVTDPIYDLAATESIARYLAGDKTEDETTAEKEGLEETRFMKEKMSHRDYLKTQSYMGIDIPPESKEALKTAILSNRQRFKPRRQASLLDVSDPMRFGGAVRKEKGTDFASAASVNKSLLEWASSAKPEDLTAENIAKMNKQIYEFTKAGKDPGENISGIKLQRMIDSGNVSLSTLEFIGEAKSKGVPAWKILESDEMRLAGLPDATIDGNKETYSFGSKDQAKEAAKKLRSVAKDNNERIRIAIKGNAVIITKVED